MVKFNFLEYYKYIRVRKRNTMQMYIDLNKFLGYDVSSVKVKDCLISVRVSDYSDLDDRNLKSNVHTDIFHGDYDCKRMINRLYKSAEFLNGFGMFFTSIDSDGKECVIGSSDILKYGNSYVLSNFGIIDEFKGNGYSYLCLYNTLSTVISKGIRELFLYVNSDNDVAIKLYKSFGFEVI